MTTFYDFTTQNDTDEVLDRLDQIEAYLMLLANRDTVR